ncbi:MAG: hypothetical protein JWN04_1935 [Myxococcaceae bacterium]|nr:hypothetical protein [Myxococcaceae bacterium]
MTNTIVGYFDDFADARRAEQDLIDSGFGGQVKVVGQKADGMEFSESTQTESWWDKVKESLGFADEHALHQYKEATTRGGTLVSVSVPEERLEQAVEIIERHHPVDLDQRAAGWSESKATLTGVGAAEQPRTPAESQATIPLAEEELQVGKRAVQRGTLRVHTYVTERPVEQSVSLREEKAFIDRHPVDRAATGAEAAFQERTIEVRELGEEAVVGKKARVVEEVAIGKQQTARTETVRDTVRKTEVAVDRDEPTRKKI